MNGNCISNYLCDTEPYVLYLFVSILKIFQDDMHYKVSSSNYLTDLTRRSVEQAFSPFGLVRSAQLNSKVMVSWKIS